MSAIDILRVATGIAGTIGSRGGFAAVYALPPAITDAESATVVPTGGRADSYCAHELTFDVVLAASGNDFGASLEWLAGRIDTVTEALAADPSAGGVCDGVLVASWGEFFTTTIGGGADALAVRLTLTPTTAVEA